jgi:hypothetical protein
MRNRQEGTYFHLISVCFVVGALLAIWAPERALAQNAAGAPKLGEVIAGGAPATNECLAQLYILRFDAFRYVIHCLQAWTEYNIGTCEPISVGNYEVITQPKRGTISTTVIGPYHLGNGDCPDHTYNFKLARYNWTDSGKIAKLDRFTLRWYTPDGQVSAGPWDEVAVLAPRILGPNEVWWFDGEQPNEATYPTSIRLRAAPSGYTYRWNKVLAGNGDVDLTPESSTLAARARGLHASSATEDVCIEVSTSVSGPSNPFCLTVLAPTLEYVFSHDIPATDFGQPVGYESDIHYRIRDQFNNILPDPIPWNETFTTGVVRDYVCNPAVPPPCPNWNRGAQVGGTVDPNDAVDHVSIFATAFGVLRPSPKFPAAGSDALTCTSPGQRRLDHWQGEWRVGGPNVGDGVLAETLTWQRYTDHARHCNQVFPPP